MKTLALLVLTSFALNARAATAPTCEEAFTSQRALAVAPAHELEARLADQWHANPYSIGFRANEIVDTYFASTLDEIREMLNFLIRDDGANNVSSEAGEISKSETALNKAHAQLNKVVGLVTFSNFLHAWDRATLPAKVRELVDDINSCRIQARACGLRLPQKVSALETHLSRVVELQNSLEVERLALEQVIARAEALHAPADLELALNHKLHTIQFEEGNLANHVVLIKTQFNDAALAAASINSIETMMRSAIQIGRPYLEDYEKARALIEAKARSEILSRDEAALIEKFKSANSLTAPFLLKKLAGVQHFEATNAILQSISWQKLGARALERIRFALSNKRYRPQNLEALRKIGPMQFELLLAMKNDGFFAAGDPAADDALLDISISAVSAGLAFSLEQIEALLKDTVLTEAQVQRLRALFHTTPDYYQGWNLGKQHLVMRVMAVTRGPARDQFLREVADGQFELGRNETNPYAGLAPTRSYLISGARKLLEGKP